MIVTTKPSLLVVDDQAANIQILYQIFSEDYEVFMATSGVQALEFCAVQIPDLILLDVIMPEMNGHAVCVSLKADQRTQDIPIIFVTAQHDPSEETKGLQLGAVDFITKPINAAVVRARVRAHLMLSQSLRQVQDLNDHLEERVAQRTLELNQALEHLSQSRDELAQSEAKATLSTLIASVSHELGTPIGNSRTVASSLKDRVKTVNQLIQSGQLKRSNLEEFLHDLSDGTNLMLNNLERAVTLLGNFRQVSADQASEQRRNFDLADVVGEIIGTMRPLLKRHPHQVIVEIPAGILMDSQPGPIGQIVINLVNNAYLHAFEGRSDGVLTIRARLDGDQVILSFSDNGVGMTSENVARLFEPFFSTKIGKGGTGLGMAIVKNLASKTLQGWIEVKSVLGQGTNFEVHLPRVLKSQ
ncbi:MAG: hybrid sensor histidine kinase/response regulator [Undibacterium sp.]|nr:hybrid sensor histidine kinase/response regulator [Undibacterium sp.]